MPRRQISLIYRRNRRQPRAVQAFVGLLREIYGVELPEEDLIPA